MGPVDHLLQPVLHVPRLRVRAAPLGARGHIAVGVVTVLLHIVQMGHRVRLATPVVVRARETRAAEACPEPVEGLPIWL